MSANASPGYGTFGNLSQNYDHVRRGMPREVLEYLNTTTSTSRILDVGCGTGIITRQLSTFTEHIVGVDIDEDMLRVAQSHITPHITYLKAAAEDLSAFPTETFSLVTAFSAFHWFANDQALGEIRRVLTSGGQFFAANRTMEPSYREAYRTALQAWTEQPLPDSKKDYAPTVTLQNAGFINVKEKAFPLSDMLSVEEALAHLQTTSPWNLIPDNRKADALSGMRKFFEAHTVNGAVDQHSAITTVRGTK